MHLGASNSRRSPGVKHDGLNAEVFEQNVNRLRTWRNSSPDIPPELFADEVHRVARICAVPVANVLGLLAEYESESRGAAIVRLRATAEAKCGSDISPCGHKSWGQCLTLDPYGNFILWFDTPDKSTHIAQ